MTRELTEYERLVQQALKSLTLDRAVEIEEGAPASECELEAHRRWKASMAPVQEKLSTLARTWERVPARDRRRFPHRRLVAYLGRSVAPRRTSPGRQQR